MSSVLKKEIADQRAYSYNPKAFRLAVSDQAKDFVFQQETKGSDFVLAEIVAAQSGIEELKKKNLEEQVESTVLGRMKEIEEQAYKEAYALGLNEGQERAYADKSEELDQMLSRIDAVMQNIESLKLNMLKENETTLVKLVFDVAKKIAMREITVSQEPVLTLLIDLIQEAQGAESILVKMNQSDLTFIEEIKDKRKKDLALIQKAKLVGMDDISPGGCIIETNYGEIDATIEERATKGWVILAEKLPVIKTDRANDGSS